MVALSASLYIDMDLKAAAGTVGSALVLGSQISMVAP